MSNDLIPSGNGISIPLNGNSLFIPNAEISNYGCRNCVWKLHNQCPYGLEEDEVIEFNEFNELIEPKRLRNSNTQDFNLLSKGICLDMLSFLGSLAEKDGGLDSVLEKFHIYKARLQEASDYKDFMELQKKIRAMEAELKHSTPSENQITQLDNLKMDMNAAKLWWAKLNQYAVFSMQKINDRKSKSKEPSRIYGAKTVNFNISNEKKQIE